MLSSKLEMEIEEVFDDFCKGCTAHNLKVETELLFAYGFPYDRSLKLTCSNLPLCRQLHDRMESRNEKQ